MNPERIAESDWERAVSSIAEIAGPRGGSDERAERARRAAHALCGPFNSSESWELVQGLLAIPEPVQRVVVAVAQILTAIVYGGAPRDRQRRARLLNELLKEAEAVAAERRVA